MYYIIEHIVIRIILYIVDVLSVHLTFIHYVYGI